MEANEFNICFSCNTFNILVSYRTSLIQMYVTQQKQIQHCLRNSSRRKESPSNLVWRHVLNTLSGTRFVSLSQLRHSAAQSVYPLFIMAPRKWCAHGKRTLDGLCPLIKGQDTVPVVIWVTVHMISNWGCHAPAQTVNIVNPEPRLWTEYDSAGKGIHQPWSQAWQVASVVTQHTVSWWCPRISDSSCSCMFVVTRQKVLLVPQDTILC